MRSMLVLVVAICCCTMSAAVKAGEELPPGTYVASAIPVSLSQGANAVIRYDVRVFTVESVRSARLKVHFVSTILTPAGRELGELQLSYDTFVEIENLDGRILDGNGNEIRSLRDDDIKDWPATSDISLYEDNRIRIATLYHGVYPYTIEFTYEMSYHGYISWPSWYPEDDKGAVEYSRFQVLLPEGEKLRYHSNTSIVPEVTSAGDWTTYTWECRSLPLFVREPLGPTNLDQYQSVRIAPGRFEIDHISGNFSSWKSFGEWFGSIQENRQSLPEDARTAVSTLIADVTGRRDRIKVLYEYLQSTTRYVSIQLGIGGWQPFEAEYVWKKKYGDCKALVNYMRALLDVAGIPSYPVLIWHGEIPLTFIEEFPSNRFNHVILCVPDGVDSIWLECTSPTIPFNHIGSGNELRTALMITPEGGSLVRTPTGAARSNSQVRVARVELNQSGDGKGSVRTVYSGNQQDHVRSALVDATPKERDDWLRESIDIPVFELRNADLSGVSAGKLEVDIKLLLGLPGFAKKAGKRLMFQPNLMERRVYVPKPMPQRKHPVILPYVYCDVDSVTYGIPGGFSVEALPKPSGIATDFGSYSSSISQPSPNLLLYTRKLEFTAAEIAPARYEDYRKFLEEVVRADKAVVVLADTR